MATMMTIGMRLGPAEPLPVCDCLVERPLLITEKLR